MSELDFKGVLDQFVIPVDPEGTGTFDVVEMEENEVKTIQTALRIADRLQSGEVSDEMMEVGYSEGDGCTYASSVFKAMAKELIKEES